MSHSNHMLAVPGLDDLIYSMGPSEALLNELGYSLPEILMDVYISAACNYMCPTEYFYCLYDHGQLNAEELDDIIQEITSIYAAVSKYLKFALSGNIENLYDRYYQVEEVSKYNSGKQVFKITVYDE